MSLALAFSLKWFFGFDSIFEGISLIVTLLIAFYGFRVYNLTNDKKCKWFAYAFLLIGASFLFKILTNVIIYWPVIHQQTFGFITVKVQSIQQSHIIFTIGFLIHRFLMMMGLIVLYAAVKRSISSRQLILLTYFVLITTLFSRLEYFVFYITTSVLLLFIFMHSFKNHVHKQTDSSLFVTSSYFLFLLSQICFIFIFITTYFYVIGELFQLLSFLILLHCYINMIRIKS